MLLFLKAVGSNRNIISELHLSVLLKQMGTEHNVCHKLTVKEGLGDELSTSLFKDTV